MSQKYYVLRFRHIFGLLVAAIAFAATLAVAPLPTLAQGASGPVRPNDAGSGATSPTAATDVLPQVPEVDYIPPTAIGTILDLSLAATVPPEEITLLRSDLILLAQTLDSLGPRIAEHNVETGFTEAQINAMSDDELTAFYNAIPDVPQFHMAITALADLLQHPVASRNLELGESKAAPRRSMIPRMAPGTMALASNLPFNQALPAARTDRGTSQISVCPETRSDDATIFALKIINNTLVIAATVLDGVCQVFIDIPCPIGSGGKFPPVCIASGIAQAAQLAFFFAIDLANVCDTHFSNRTAQASWVNSKAVHTNLDAHHMDIMTILEEFRQLVIRTGVEENLLMNADLRLSLFQLPQGPHTAVSIQRTREIVQDTIQRNQLAGMPIGNAQAEFDAGESLLALNKYKDAYGRYRNAYRAAVGQTIR